MSGPLDAPTTLPTMPPSLAEPVTYAPTPTAGVLTYPPTPTGFIADAVTSSPSPAPTGLAWSTTDTIITSVVVGVAIVVLVFIFWTYQSALATKADGPYTAVSQSDPEAQPLQPSSSSSFPRPPAEAPPPQAPKNGPAPSNPSPGYVPGSYIPGSKPLLGKSPFKPAEHLA